MARAVFARTKPRHVAAVRSIATAVRDFEKNIPEEPTRYPTILSLDLPFQPTPADYHLYGIVLGAALDRAIRRLQRRPDIDLIQYNVGIALSGHATK